MTAFHTAVPGLKTHNNPATTGGPYWLEILPGEKLFFSGQTANTAAGNVANQGIGTVALPVITAGTTGTVTISDTQIRTTSIVMLTVKQGPTPDATAGRGICVTLQAPGTGSVVVEYTPLVNMAQAWALHYHVWN